MADESKWEALQKHEADLREEPVEALAERYGMTPGDRTVFEKFADSAFQVAVAGPLSWTPASANTSQARRRAETLAQTEKLRSRPRRFGAVSEDVERLRPPTDSKSIIRKLEPHELQGYHEPLHAAMPSELQGRDMAFSPPFEGGHAYGITRPPTTPIDLDSDDGEYFSERLGGPRNVSDTYRQQAGDRVSRVARELGAGSGIFTAPKGTLEQIRKWEETAIDELKAQATGSK